MRIIDCIQATPEWWEARRGLPTASAFDRILTSTGKPSAQADGYICELIADTAMQLPQYFSGRGRPVTKAMTNGTDSEPEARRYYEMLKDTQVRQVGFCLHDSGLFGCSPDALVGDDGVLELKVPELKTQAHYLMKPGSLLADYRQQIHGHLIVTERKWCEVLSYSHGLDPLVIRVEPDAYTETLMDALMKFCDKLAEAKKKLLKGAV